MIGTYHVNFHWTDCATITFFGSDADTARKGWRSIGCQSIPVSDLPAAIEAIERNGYRRETRSALDMALAHPIKAESGAIVAGRSA